MAGRKGKQPEEILWSHVYHPRSAVWRRLEARLACNRRLRCRWLVQPENVAARRQLRALGEPARLLFVPRGLALRSQAVAAILRGCSVSARSLRPTRTA